MKTKNTSKNKAAALNARLWEFLDFAPPKDLRRSLQHVFFNYLNQKGKVFPKNFDEISTDFYLLLAFLEDAEELLEDTKMAKAQTLIVSLSRNRNKQKKLISDHGLVKTA